MATIWPERSAGYRRITVDIWHFGHSSASSGSNASASLIAVLIGAEAGAGDRFSGVMRDLVVTGRSRLALVPGAGALPLLALAFAVARPLLASVAQLGLARQALPPGAPRRRTPEPLPGASSKLAS